MAVFGRRCRHIYKVVEKQVLESAMAEAMRQSGNVRAEDIGALAKVSAPIILVHYRCELCGTERVEKV